MTERNPNAAAESSIPGRLNEFDRDEIRAAHSVGISVEQLMKEYKRTKTTILRILKRND